MSPLCKLLWVLHCPARHNIPSQQSSLNRGLHRSASKAEDAASQLQVPSFVAFAASVEAVYDCRDCMHEGIPASCSMVSPPDIALANTAELLSVMQQLCLHVYHNGTCWRVAET